MKIIMIKAIIFDIDGTLIDSNKAHAQSFVKAFDKFGKTVSYIELKWLIGMGADKILDKYLSQNEIEKFGKKLTEYRKELFLENYLPSIKTFPKLKDLFTKLSEDKKKIALASSASDEELSQYKKLLNISRFLDEETTSDDAAESKPEPDIFEAAFKKLKNINKKDVLVIGDTPYDAQAAVKAGLKIIGVKTGDWSAESLIADGCFEVYENLSEILINYDKIFA